MYRNNFLENMVRGISILFEKYVSRKEDLEVNR